MTYRISNCCRFVETGNKARIFVGRTCSKVIKTFSSKFDFETCSDWFRHYFEQLLLIIYRNLSKPTINHPSYSFLYENLTNYFTNNLRIILRIIYEFFTNNLRIILRIIYDLLACK